MLGTSTKIYTSDDLFERDCNFTVLSSTLISGCCKKKWDLFYLTKQAYFFLYSFSYYFLFPYLLSFSYIFCCFTYFLFSNILSISSFSISFAFFTFVPSIFTRIFSLFPLSKSYVLLLKAVHPLCQNPCTHYLCFLKIILHYFALVSTQNALIDNFYYMPFSLSERLL